MAKGTVARKLRARAASLFGLSPWGARLTWRGKPTSGPVAAEPPAAPVRGRIRADEGARRDRAA